MALLYTDAQTPQEKVVDIIVSSSILDNIKSNYLREAKTKIGERYSAIIKTRTDSKNKIDIIGAVADIYPNNEYCSNTTAKDFEEQLRLIAMIRNEFSHDERFTFILGQDWGGLNTKSSKVLEIIGGKERIGEDTEALNIELCKLLMNEGSKTVRKRIHELELDTLYLLFDYAFNQIRNFICMYRYDGLERDEYLFGIKDNDDEK